MWSCCASRYGHMTAPGNQPANDALPTRSVAEDHHRLIDRGIDPRRIALHKLGLPKRLLWHGYPPWIPGLTTGLALWLVLITIEFLQIELPTLVLSAAALLIGLLILKSACDVLVTAAERLAARQSWDHYLAGTFTEILSTVPELVVICFIIPVSPITAMVIALVTIYNNALVFSLYSYFLPKNQKGHYVMPAAITEAGTQVLIAGAGFGSIIGLVMLTFSAGGHSKQAFSAMDLGLLGIVMLTIFGVYAYKLIESYASEEKAVHQALELDSTQVQERKKGVYEQVKHTSLTNIVWLFVVGTGAAFLGGERVSTFAESALQELHLNSIATAILLAAFAGMSEYVILWRAHRKAEYRIALANAFGGITQVMFLVLPFTLLAIAVYQGLLGAEHAELPLSFTLSNILLFLLLFPTFYVLIALLEEDHTLGILDTTIMVSIFLLIIMILLAYGGG